MSSNSSCCSSALPSVSLSELNNLGPGCYVKIKSAQGCHWAEISEIEGQVCTGRVHNELCDDAGIIKLENPLVRFDKSQIVDLGCDNYCFC